MAEMFFVLGDGEKIPVVVATRRGIKNITLRPKTAPVREIHISKPWLTPAAVALRFLERKRRWVEQIYLAAPAKTCLGPGMHIQCLGRDILLQHDPARYVNSYDAATGVLVIGGAPDMFERRLREWVKKEFLRAVKDIIKTVPREFWPRRIALRDTTTRWGSCSSTGTISFSWRLAFAPVDVMRYVIMHELAHRKYMDHSPEFWTQVSHLYGFGVERAKRWLSLHGGRLHQYL